MPALFPSPQAILPNWDPSPTNYAVAIARRTQIDPPRIKTLAASTLVFDARPDAGDKKVVAKLVLQNLGANNMYVALNQAAQIADGGYHFVLPGGGTQLDLSSDQPEYVSVRGTDGDKVLVYISYPKESQPV